MNASAQRAAVIDAIARELAGLDLGHPVRVGVDGITAAGKTTFANELAAATEAHGRPCRRITMDGFHHPRAIRYRQGRGSADGYFEDAYDFDALRREVLDPLGPSGDGRYRTAVIDLAADVPLELEPERADARLVVVVDGSFLQKPVLNGGWDRIVFLRTSFAAALERGVARDAAQLGSHEEAERIFTTRYHAAQHRYLAEADPERGAALVVEHDDPQRPVIRAHRSAASTGSEPRVADSQAFFGPRASGWNERFAEDGPAFVRAVGETGIAPGSTVIDVGCGAGRVLPALMAAAGPGGRVVGVDVTREMLDAARPQVSSGAALVLGDAQRLPIADVSCDALFAAGLLSHLANPVLGLVELARVARAGAVLALFHPVGRSRLAAKHGHPLRPDDPLDPQNLSAVLDASGWVISSVDDGPDRYLARATKAGSHR